VRRTIILILCIAFLLCACGNSSGYYLESEVTAFVQEHEDEIRRQIESAAENETISEFDGIGRVYDRRNSHGVISYEYKASGIAVSGLQAGFYYSVDDEPSCYGGPGWAGGPEWSEVETEQEDLWRYEGDGDNYYITKKICANFYYFLAAN